MAVAFDAVGPSSSGTGGATSPLTWTHVNGGNGILVGVTIFNGNTNTVTGVTYGGVSLTLQGFIPGDNSTAGGIALYGKVGAAVPTGSNTVSVSFSDGANHNAGSISVSGAGSLGTPVTGFANATSVSVSVAGTTTGGLIVATASFGGSQLNTFSGTNGVTVRWQHPGSGNSGSDNGVGGTVASTGGGASQSVGFSDTGTDFWGIVAVEVLPSSGSIDPPPFQLNPPGLQSPMAFSLMPQLPVSYDVAAGAVAGTVQPLATRQPRRTAARAYWRGFISATTNLQPGTVPDHLVIARRSAARAVWRGYTSFTTNLRNGNQPGGAIYRRRPARAVTYRNPAPFPPPIGTIPPKPVIARRAAARASWRGFTSSTTNLLSGSVPAHLVVARRSAARAVWHGYVSSTTNLRNGTIQPRAAVPVPRRLPARPWYPKAPVTGAAPPPPAVSATVSLASGLVISRRQVRAIWGGAYTPPSNTPAAAIPGTVPLHLVIARRQAARAVWRGFISSTTNLLNGTVPDHLVVARRAAARAVWRGYISSTTNLRNGNEPGGVVYRRKTARAVVHGNPAPFPPPIGTVPDHLTVARRSAARAVWAGTVSRTVNVTPVISGTAPLHLVVGRRTAARAYWRGFTSSTVNAVPAAAPAITPHLVIGRRTAARAFVHGNPVPGQQALRAAGSLIRRRAPARGLWHGNPGTVPAGGQVTRIPVASRRKPARAFVKGITVRTTNALPVAVPAPHQRLTVPRRTASRILWRGVIPFAQNANVVKFFSAGQPFTSWSPGQPYTSWETGLAFIDDQRGQPFTGWDTGLVFTGWETGDPYIQ